MNSDNSDRIYREILDIMSKMSKESSPGEMLDGLVNATADVIVGTSQRPEVTAQEFCDSLRMIVGQMAGIKD
ncbi:MAG: hypothetical protein KRP56_01435 [Candidatus Methanogranum gryphiswaldense]|nr:MAG: hypothetical protein KRP56_01435 [Candidatus Methanogranum sp. U3.2.1]